MNKNFRLFLIALTTFGSAVMLVPMVTLSTLMVGSLMGVEPLASVLGDFFAGNSWAVSIAGVVTFVLMSVMGSAGIVHNLDLALTGKEWR